MDLAGIAIDTAPVFSAALIVIGAVASIWAVKKVYTTFSKS